MSSAALEPAAWQRPGLHDQVVRSRSDGKQEAVLHLDALRTPHQVLRLEAHLQQLDGLHRFDLDRTAQRLRVCWDPTRTGLVAVLEACATAGCVARPLSTTALGNTRRHETHAALRRLIVAGLFAMQAMMFATVLYIGDFETVDPITRELFRWLGLLAATPVVLWAAQPFYVQAVEELRRRRPGTETVISLAVGLVFAAGIVAAVRGHGEIWFDSISMLVFVLLLGRYLAMCARHRSHALGEAAADAEPVAAQRRRDDGSLEWVAVAELAAGDRLHVAEGAVVPADGHALNAGTLLDEALLSGESTPQRRDPGQPVAAGSMVVAGPLEMRVDQRAARSTLAALGSLARRVSTRAGDAVGDKAAARFAIRVLLLGLATALFWLWADPSRAFDAAVAVLVVACPCAFALAAPAVFSRVATVLGRHGVWITRPEDIAALARADTALFDKTGTLTEPHVDVAAVRALRAGLTVDELVPLAAALARESSHPLAQRLAQLATGRHLPEARDVEVVEGGGIRGQVDGRELRLGRSGFVRTQPVAADLASESLLLADARGLLAVFPVHEQLRLDARDSLAALASGGMRLEVLSGDATPRVERVATRLQVDAWQARQSTRDKLARAEALRAGGAVVLAVGDGSNDAPLLAAADVSAAMVHGTELAQVHASMLLTEGLAGLPLARHVARAAGRILRQNHRGSLAYNLVAVPFAAAGLVPPWLAIIGMCASSLAVVLNSLRIRTGERDSGAAQARQHMQTA